MGNGTKLTVDLNDRFGDFSKTVSLHIMQKLLNVTVVSPAWEQNVNRTRGALETLGYVCEKHYYQSYSFNSSNSFSDF